MDPANSGVSTPDLRQREQMVAEWVDRHGYPVVYALAGGYTTGITMAELIDLHLLSVEAFG
jgi:acetoin utilization deacetylase AcuC-like enzyme